MERRRWMLWMLSAAIAFAVVSSPARAQDASAEDKEKALKYLESTKKQALETTHGLSDAQWNFKPAPDKWSIAEVAEHIAAAEDLLRGLIVEKVMKGPPVPGRDLAKEDAGIVNGVPDRSQKFQAPEPLRPTNRFGSPDGSVKHFVESRAHTEEFLKNTADLRGHVADSPVGGKWDAYQYILLIAAHSERHTKQIEEVKASPGYPAK